MDEQVTGGCKCGSVRYIGQRSSEEMFRCFCRDCQQLTGSGHSNMVPLCRSGFETQGNYRVFEMVGGSGAPTWSGFCGTCGAPLTRSSKRMAKHIYVHAGSLDDPTLYNPKRFIYAEAAQPWDLGKL